MGKKKFIDKKKAVSLTLMDAPSRYENKPEQDRAFYRVDNNPILLDTFGYDPIYADAPEDSEFDGNEWGVGSSGPLPEHVRKEILMLGCPDDGYNYLLHLREMRYTEGGARYLPIENPRLVQRPQDVKAYDASRVQITAASDDLIEKSIFSVASNTISLKGRRTVDAEVAALLDDSDLSRFGSDVEELDEDFVIQANAPVEGEDVGTDNTPNSVKEQEGMDIANGKHVDGEQSNNGIEKPEDCVDDNPRFRRFIDDQFDLFERQEYGSDENDDDDGHYADCMDEEAGSLADKLKHVLEGNNMTDDLGFDDKYKVPADILNDKQNPESKELEVVVRRCVEYAEKYENEDEKGELVVVEESSDESEVWDCETIVSTYSNLDNHPGKIGVPLAARRKKIADVVSGASGGNSHVITLKGKEKLPVEYLPHSKKPVTEKMKGNDSEKAGHQRRKQHGQESKEEKKERKAAVKEERRAARLMKKEMKELYKSEAQRAQRVAAISGPSSVHLM